MKEISIEGSSMVSERLYIHQETIMKETGLSIRKKDME
jgi:hypothetical protein